MIGAMAGDIIGSVYEGRRWDIKTTDFPLFDPHCRFTDDTVLTAATADAILSGSPYGAKYKEWYRAYPDRGYGGHFRIWAASEDPNPYWSLGNGSAMRVSPVAWAFGTLERVLEEAGKSAEVTHNHPEGIRGAQTVAAAVFLARTGTSREEIRAYVRETFGYRLERTLDEIRPTYRFDSSCPGSVPEAITAFLESEGFEDAVRKAISLGGDSDTIACMTGAIAEAFYGGVPAEIEAEVLKRLDAPVRGVLQQFQQAFVVPGRRVPVPD